MTDLGHSLIEFIILGNRWGRGTSRHWRDRRGVALRGSEVQRNGLLDFKQWLDVWWAGRARGIIASWQGLGGPSLL